MDFFRAGEALIRSSQPLLLPFLTPTAYRSAGRIGAASRRSRLQLWQCQSGRTFTDLQRNSQQSNTAASEIAQLADSMQSQRRPGSQQDDLTAELLDSTLDYDKHVPGAPTGRTSRFTSKAAQQRQRPADSIDEFLTNMTSNSPRRTTPSNTSPSRPNPQVDQTLTSILSGSGGSSTSPSDLTLDIDNIFSLANQSSFDNRAPMAKAVEGTNTPADFKLDSTTGRVIPVDASKGIDAARAFRMLGSRLTQNNVKSDFQRQRFHERPGLRRKRLKSQRWRKRFREAFQTTVQKVVGMKRMGW